MMFGLGLGVSGITPEQIVSGGRDTPGPKGWALPDRGNEIRNGSSEERISITPILDVTEVRVSPISEQPQEAAVVVVGLRFGCCDACDLTLRAKRNGDVRIAEPRRRSL